MGDRYRVIKARNTAALSERVEKALSDGFVPTGGVTSVMVKDGGSAQIFYEHYQAVWRPVPSP